MDTEPVQSHVDSASYSCVAGIEGSTIKQENIIEEATGTNGLTTTVVTERSCADLDSLQLESAQHSDTREHEVPDALDTEDDIVTSNGLPKSNALGISDAPTLPSDPLEQVTSEESPNKSPNNKNSTTSSNGHCSVADETSSTPDVPTSTTSEPPSHTSPSLPLSSDTSSLSGKTSHHTPLSDEATIITTELTEVSLLDDDSGDASSGRQLDLALPPPPPPPGDGASSPLSELSDELPLTTAAGRRPPPNGLRVDVETEARLFNLTDRVAALTEENAALQEKLKRAQEESSRLSTENDKERSHIVTLEGQLASLRSDLDQQREDSAAASRRQQEASRALELDLTSRLSRTRAQFEAACRDKDKMVLRYAQSEKSVIDAKREAAAADRRVKEAAREKEMLVGKVNHMVQERNRMSQQMEAKVQEVKALTKDSTKLKEEVESRDVRIKWLQNKMKHEADSYKEGQLRMETLLRELREAQDTIRQYKLTEDNRSSALDRELREEKARRMVEEKLKQDSTNKEQALTGRLQELQERCHALEQESAQRLERALSAEAALEPAEAARGRLAEEADCLRRQVETLLHDSAELDETRATLERERERVAASQAEVASLQASQADLQADLDACHAKEADLLDFTQRLTEKNVELQSQISGFQARCQAAEFEARQFDSRREELESRLSDVTGRLTREQEARSTDNQLLARRLAERTRQVEELTRRAEDAESQTAIARRKHHSSVRELQRELAQARRRLESQEPSPAPTPADGLSQASRASSSVSLEAPPPAEAPPVVQVAAPAEPDRQALIERIVRLQRQVARRSEKIDFLEEHVNSLVEEVRRKSRLLQHYLVREEAGALASQDRDLAKSDLMRKGGIMASVYGSHAKDQTMTLELSLEINSKLQTVLEDTLLKNMTLKDNMSVLGEEIASLTEQNRQLRRQ